MNKKTLFLLVIPLLFYVFFSLKLLVGGDWHYLFLDTTKTFPNVPSIYKAYVEFGQNVSPLAGLEQYSEFTSKLFLPFISFNVYERFFWLFPFLFFSIISSYKLTKSVIGSLIYTTNTYILMILGGGQLGIVLAYSLMPFAILQLINLFHSASKPKLILKNILLLAFAFGSVLWFDIRIFYISIIVVVIFFAFQLAHLKKKTFITFFKKIFYVVLGLLVGILFNFGWILGLIVSQKSSVSGLGSAITNAGIISFLSFANFSDSFGLLHPNWPDNIFGKVYFMRPEFLLLPIVAFFSLFFVKKVSREDKEKILFFSLLGLIGIFLAKGSNPPFGQVYLWMFQKIPGFVMFRDATKFYILIAISYAVLIPTTLGYVVFYVGKIIRNPVLPKLIPILFVFFWLFLIRQLWLNQLTGIFTLRSLPNDYVALEKFLASQNDFFRTLWIPQKDIFGFYSNNQPYFEGLGLFTTNDPTKDAQKMKSSSVESKLQRLSIKYVIVPIDSEGIMFVKDRKYNDVIRQQTIKKLDSIDWIQKIYPSGLQNFAIYKIPNTYQHFWIEDKNHQLVNNQISFTCKTSTQCFISINSQMSDYYVIFSERYDPLWYLQVGNQKIYSQETFDNLNQFHVVNKQSFDATIIYTSQSYMPYGLAISVTFLIFASGILVYISRKKYNNYS